MEKNNKIYLVKEAVYDIVAAAAYHGDFSSKRENDHL